jgi:photosystem I subunit 9
MARGFRTLRQKTGSTSVFHFVLTSMKDFTTYLSTAPVVALGWFTVTAALLIEINRFFPDPLVFSF